MKKLEEIKNPNDILEYMDNIRYGYVDINNEEHINCLPNFRKNYRTMSLEDTLNHRLGTCIEQVYLMHTLLDNLNIPNKMFCTRVYESGHVDDDKKEEMHCFILYYDEDGVHQIEHPNGERKGLHHFKTEEEAINKINTIYIKMSNGIQRPVTQYFEVTPGLTFKEFNDYINSLDKKDKLGK